VPHTSATPSQIGPYRIRGVLGRGGMGVVYDAEADGRRVAIKTVLGLRNKLVHAVRREIHALALLKHPGIVAIVDEGTHEDAPWYAMELVEGPTLRAWVRAVSDKAAPQSDTGSHASFIEALRTGLGGEAPPSFVSEAPTVTHSGALLAAAGGTAPTGGSSGSDDLSYTTRPGRVAPPLSEGALPELLAVVRRLCLALEYLHGRGLVYRDLKPDNVLVGPGGAPVIVDFGLVFHVSGVGGRESIDELALLGAGTARYMAPEQIRGEGVDARADLYSLGCVLYELLSGRAPFDGPSSLAVLNQQLNAPPPPLREHCPWISEALEGLIGALLEKRPQDRPASAALVAHRLRALEEAGAADIEDDVTREYTRAPHPVLYRPPLAGRVGALQSLAERLAGLERAEDRGGIILLVGASGIGKTRLALEAARRAADAGALVLAGEATARGARPLAPLRKVLQLVSEKCTRGGAEKTTTLLGRNAKVFAAYEPSLVVVPGFELFPDPEPLPAPEARRRLLESLRATLDTLAREEPLLLILDDLQWADELTLAFLDHLASSDGDAPFLVLATVRAEEGEDIVETLGDRARASTLRLDRLTPEDVHAMIDGALGTRPPEALVRLVEDRAGGVPFWVTEVLHAAISQRILERDQEGAWQLHLEREGALPASAIGMLELRIEGLAPSARALADAAAVLGRGGAAAVLERVSGLSEGAFLEAMATLRTAQILEDDAEEGLRFTHDKLAEVAYALLSAEARETLHGRAADALEAAAPAGFDETGTQVAETLAFHHENAGRLEKAAAGWILAGDGARRLSALKDAERCYERAIGLLEKIGDVAGLAKTLMKLGLVHAAAFETAGAQRAYQRAFSLWAELGDPGAPQALHQTPPTARIRVTNQPKSLDPARAYDSDSLFVLAQLFEGLVELDVDANVLPAAATSWDISADGRVYTFHLRSNARWSDGAPLLASDFELSWKRTLDPRTRSPVSQLLYVLEHARAYHEGRITDPGLVGVHARGPKTLEVRLNSPSAYLLNLLSHPATFPIPAKTFFEHGVRWTLPGNMVSNGPFVLEEREPLRVRLRRNPLFTGRAEGNVAEIEVNAYRNYKETTAAFAAERLDILDMIAADADVLAEAARLPGELRFLPLHSTQYLVLRADRPPLDDERVRKALALLIDRDAMERRLKGTSHLVARGGFIAPGVAGHSPSLALRHDPERAAALFAEAGFSDPAALPPLVWLHTHGLGDTTLLELVRQSWTAAGIRIEVKEVDWDQYERLVETDPPHVVLGGWIADYPDPDTFMRAVFHSVEGAEHIGWADARFDELVEAAAKTAEPRTRDELYATADHMIVADRAVIVPLTYGQNPVLLRRSIRSFPGAGSYLRPMKMVVVDDGT
jgi:ABC-type oligopeptide transport system substrate-binding subunit/serine/threonine protein kinase